MGTCSNRETVPTLIGRLMLKRAGMGICSPAPLSIQKGMATLESADCEATIRIVPMAALYPTSTLASARRAGAVPFGQSQIQSTTEDDRDYLPGFSDFAL